jgi:glycogen debranching enzyme
LRRIERIIGEAEYLQKHFDFIEDAAVGKTVPGAICPQFSQREELGYCWNGIASGMDNTPRGRDDYESILWFDLLAQQALSADRIVRMAELIGRGEIASDFRARYERLKAIALEHYWDEEDGIFHDIKRDDHSFVKVKTPTAYWGLLAGFCDEAKASRLAALAKDPTDGFGGPVPWPTVPPSDPDFHPDGYYWRGGVWLPTAYMATCALREAGHEKIGDLLAERLLAQMYRTWKQYEPATIWEAYSPTKAEPATDKDEFAGQRVRPDFCGWSALGPIALFIESVLGFGKVDALKREVYWNLRREKRCGIKRLRFGGVTTDLIFEEGRCEVRASGPYTLILNGKRIEIQTGEQSFAAG